MTDNSNGTNRTTQGPNNSTLIEFPGVNRNRPAWRKELSERFREIQQRRAREAALEAEESQAAPAELSDADYIAADAPPEEGHSAAAKQLGLVPPPDEPEVNPIVAAALRRLERARGQSGATTVTRQGSGRAHAATAAARKVEERAEEFEEPLAVPTHTPVKRAESLSASAAMKPAPQPSEGAATQREQTRPSPLAVVQPAQSSKPEQPLVVEAKASVAEAEASAHSAARVETASTTAETVKPVETEKRGEGRAPAASPRAEAKVKNVETKVEAAHATALPTQALDSTNQEQARQPRHLEGVIDEFWLERHGVELLPKVASPEVTYDDRAPRAKRLAAAVIDLIAVAFLSAPFAALIELTIGNWGDPRVFGSMGAIVVVVMFLYHTCSVALAGRTWGMSLCSLHVVDADTASAPTTGQCMRRALVFMLSLATLCLGILYSLFDAEGRTAHDILSGTVIVRQ